MPCRGTVFVEEFRTLLYPGPLVLLIGCCLNCCKYDAVLLLERFVEDPPEHLYGLLERLDGKSRNSKPEDEKELFDTVGKILLSGRALLLYL